MHNSKEEISANEINKYLYCNYQWYYSRYYDSQYIIKKRKELMEELGYNDSSKSNFTKGTNFHNEYYRNLKIKKLMFVAIVFVAVVVFLVVLFLWGRFS